MWVPAQEAINKIDLALLHFQTYGKDFLSQHKLAPDALVQMALQLAYYRLHHECPPTYESASTRVFARGRTETIRTLSEESKEMCEKWDASNVGRLSIC